MSLSAAVITKLNESVYQTLYAIGNDAGLPPLEWRITHELDLILVQGNPLTSVNFEQCERWSDLLNLVLLTESTEHGNQIWGASAGAWSLQLNAAGSPPQP